MGLTTFLSIILYYFSNASFHRFSNFFAIALSKLGKESLQKMQPHVV